MGSQHEFKGINQPFNDISWDLVEIHHEFDFIGVDIMGFTVTINLIKNSKILQDLMVI